MKKKYKKQARVAMAVALAITSVANSAGSIFAQEELEISEHDILNNEEVPHSEKAVGDIEINASNFPDDIFRDYVSNNFDTDKDGILSSDELNKITYINITSDLDYDTRQKITSVVGIEYFPNLRDLSCAITKITNLDVSKNTALARLDCYDTQITSLDISNNLELERLWCRDTPLASLDVSKNTALQNLNCENTQITSIDVSNNTALEALYLGDSQITSLDVSNNTKLINLSCNNTQITNIDVSNNTALTWLKCHNTQITSLDVSNNTALRDLDCSNTQITNIDVSKNTELTNLSCSDTEITSLDVSNNTALQSLSCSYTQITNLDVSKNTALQYLYCSNTQITSLDVSKNTALSSLNCGGTQITSLDVSNNAVLTDLNCSNTQITNIDVSKNTALGSLYCDNTKITNLDVSNNEALYSLSCNNTNIAWLHIGDKLNLYSNSFYSWIDLGEIDIEFNIQEKFPGIDLNRIIDIYDATLDKTTGIVSGYTNGMPISYTYDCGTAQGNQVILNVSLNFTKSKEESHIIINDDLNKVYDGQPVVEPKNLEIIGSTGTVTFEWYVADGTKLDSAPVDAGSYKVKAILEADTNYESAEVEKAFDITKAKSTIIINDDLNKVYDGQAVEEPKNIVKTGSTGAVSFEWYTLDGTKLQAAPVNTGSYKVKAILEADTNYASAEVEKVFDITKADSTIIINDDLNKVYDGQAVKEPKDIVKTGSTGAVSFEWYTLDGTKLQGAPVDAGSYKVKAILEADGSFIGAEAEKAFDITKASSTITINDDLNKVYDGQAVEDPKDIVKTGSAGTVSFEWYTLDGNKLDAAPMNAGSYKVKAILEADTNYASVEVEKEFTISQASSTITINDDLNKVYDGQVVVDPKDIVKTGSTGAVSFEWYQTDGTKLNAAPVDAGSYKVKAILEADTNYTRAEVEKEFTISQATNQWTQELSIQNWVYGTPANTPNAVAQFGTVEYTYSTSEDGVYTDVVPSNAGTYWVKASIVATNNYGALEAKQSFMIEKANSSITIHDDLNKAYDGQAVMQPNITQIGSQSAAVYEWYVKNEGVTKADPWIRLSEAPIEIGNYKLVVRVAEDMNYHGATAEVEFSIQEAQQETTPEDSGNEGANTSTGNQVEGVQTGDRTQVGLWTMLLGLATGIMLFFTKKKSKKEK